MQDGKCHPACLINICQKSDFYNRIVIDTGVLAQLEARIAGSDEVTGSNPVSSTKV